MSDTKTDIGRCERIGIFIPTYNAGKNFEKLLQMINQQNVVFAQKIIVDSGSSDDTVNTAQQFNWEIHQISASEFDHGGTRNMGLQLMSQCDIVVMLTQDVLLTSELDVENLVAPFHNPDVACVYGRQIPHLHATPIAAFTRYFNYPVKSFQKNASSIPQLGFKTCFTSNSFAAWRVSDLIAIGGFPSQLIFGEDAYAASKLILNNKVIAYSAEAIVFHSHNYGFVEFFRRYVDIGVFHCSNPWIKQKFGAVSGEGWRYLIHEFEFILKTSPIWIFPAVLTNLAKILGYRIGLMYHHLPRGLMKSLSMNRNFWNK